MNAVLRMDNVCYSVRGRVLLENISYTGEGSGCVALLGPNGAGKSVLLEICHGLIRPTSGSISWFGEKAGGMRDDVVMTLQKPMFLARSVTANLNYMLDVQACPRPARAARIAEVLREVNLEHKAEDEVSNLSGGEQQCLSIARALLSEPRAILLDEPTAQLDMASTENIERIINRLKNSGIKIIFTTHSPAQVRRLCDEVIFIDKGRLITCAPCEDFFKHISHPAVNAFVCSQSLF